ncbi:MAG: hypothetical protein K2X98_06290 [Alphaproteobacteria bacterium]|nr:hypothetical protein [Alphaproteobacteria bacterium]
MKKILAILSLTASFFGNAWSSDDSDKNRSVITPYNGKIFRTCPKDASYPEIKKDLSYSFHATGSLRSLFDKFKEELAKSEKDSLGNIELALASYIKECQEDAPILVDLRKFSRPRIDTQEFSGAGNVPQLSTVDTVRHTGAFGKEGSQEVHSKTTLILTPDLLKNLVSNRKSSDTNQWEQISAVSEALGNLSLTFQCTTTFFEGGSKDPVQSLSIVGADVSKRTPETILKEVYEKMLIGPNAAAFTYKDVKNVYVLLVYAAEGETFPKEKWNTGSTIVSKEEKDTTTST